MLALDELDKDELLALVNYARDTKTLMIDANTNYQTGIVTIFDKQNNHEILKHDRNNAKILLENVETDEVDFESMNRDQLELVAQESIKFINQVTSII